MVGMRGANRRLVQVTLSLSTAMAVAFGVLAARAPVAHAKRPRANFTEFKLPDSAEPSGELAAGPGGNLRFSEANSTAGDILGEVSSGGSVKQILRDPQPDDSAFGVAVQPDGSVWFNNLAGDQLERRSANGDISEVSFSDDFSSGPDVRYMAAGPSGTIWFTSTDGVGELKPSRRFVRLALPSQPPAHGDRQGAER